VVNRYADNSVNVRHKKCEMCRFIRPEIMIHFCYYFAFNVAYVRYMQYFTAKFISSC